MIGRVLQKIQNEKAAGIVVVPFWPTQRWFAKFTTMCTDTPVILLSMSDAMLTHLWRSQPQLPKTRLQGTFISWRSQESDSSQRQLTNSFLATWKPGTQKQYAIYYRQWNTYCGKLSISAVSPSLENILDFLCSYLTGEFSYIAINTAHIVIDHRPVSFHPLVIRLKRGVQYMPSTP